MKTLTNNANPFILILLPVVFALIMGMSYQSQVKKVCVQGGSTVANATSLFYKGATIIKNICSIDKEKVW